MSENISRRSYNAGKSFHLFPQENIKSSQWLQQTLKGPNTGTTCSVKKNIHVTQIPLFVNKQFICENSINMYNKKKKKNSY